METFEFILLLENDKGLTTKQNVIASDSMAAVNDNIPGIYGVGTYSYKNGYVLVKKPNGVCDWFRRIHG